VLLYRAPERRAALLNTIKELGGKKCNASYQDFGSKLQDYNSRTGLAYDAGSRRIYNPDKVVSQVEVWEHLQKSYPNLFSFGESTDTLLRAASERKDIYLAFGWSSRHAAVRGDFKRWVIGLLSEE
jgi:hypothetical protein